MTRGRTAGALICAFSAAALLSGCSQVAALAPVGGNGVAEVRYGAIDVLLGDGVEILEAPACVASGDAVTCEGTTAAGETIAVVSSTRADAQLEVKVATRVLYSGSLQTVLDEAARS
ncbi:MAG: hypothetical protein EPO52_05160 [Herbiconiux sp.]|uniref:hypothetical protein n=1 Tax=Herbiconiux sp. TaxID=1871186 RepID=UPI00121599D7|nr:hypothetical protein [Herbiconiux sp.]TAJ49179.1 MAG: hypothetical protein EPO52_05160 [Herbiconiux sp.]